MWYCANLVKNELTICAHKNAIKSNKYQSFKIFLMNISTVLYCEIGTNIGTDHQKLTKKNPLVRAVFDDSQ